MRDLDHPVLTGAENTDTYINDMMNYREKITIIKIDNINNSI
jgi:hypothetical protein